jgi:thiamine biosynthesis protein ThiS
MSTLRINGEDRTFPEGIPATLADLLDRLNITGSAVVAELDGTIVKRDAFATTALKAGQTVELIRFVGGG